MQNGSSQLVFGGKIYAKRLFLSKIEYFRPRYDDENVCVSIGIYSNM